MSLRISASTRWPSSARSMRPSALLAAAVLVALAAPAVAQLQFAELVKRGLPAQETVTKATAFGDVDGDGDLDLVLGNFREQSRLYLNQGSGTFVDGTAGRMPVANHPTTSVVFGDLDNDGDLDMVVGNTFATLQYGVHSRIYVNNGAGAFTDATAARLPVGAFDTKSMVLGDVDGDGDLDLALGNWNQQSRLYRNNGAGVFTDATAACMPVGVHPTLALAFGDVDHDGDLDLVVGNYQYPAGQRSRLYLNSGTGTFTDATVARMPSTTNKVGSLAFADADGDGDLDLVVGNRWQQSRLFLNDGTGTFTDATAGHLPVGIPCTVALAAGDVDADGDFDLVLGNSASYGGRSSLYLNNGAGVFTDATAGDLPDAIDLTLALARGDVDGDGDSDIVVGNHGQSRLYLDNGGGSFTDTTAASMPLGSYRTVSVALGDLDGDGDLDLVLGNYYSPGGQQSRLYLNDGTGTFTDATVARMPVALGHTTSLALGDVDGDGDLDMVLGDKYRPCRLYLNNGTGSFADVTAARLPSLFTVHSLALGDVDGDGDLDLVLSEQRLCLNDGTGRFTDATATHMPGLSGLNDAVVFGDVDGDGDLDVVYGSGRYPYRQQSLLFLNSGTGVFTDGTATRMPTGTYLTRALVLGDVDDDGDLDMVLGNWRERDRLYLNNGTGTFADATATRLPTATDVRTTLLLGDLDEDGDADLLVGGVGGNRLYQNLRRQLDAPFVLHVGRTYELDVYSRFGPATQLEIAFPYFSTATAHIPLPPFGTVGIDPNQMLALPPFVVPQPAGVGSLSFPVPNVPALAGIAIHTQALLQPYPGPLRLTNVVTDVILR